MKEKLIGREKETKILRECLDSGRSEFVAVYGRRRVGKTFFIRQAVGAKVCFSMTGMENADMNDQLSNFYFTLRKVFPKANRPTSWIEAFDLLETYLEQLPKGNKVVIIDELPWLDTVRSKFVGALELFWNAWASARTDVKLIVCGSATSWMIDNIINGCGGLHNRTTHQIYIAPFTLGETQRYFKEFGFGYRKKEIAECYMVMGGVAYYYSLMRPAESVAQNIDRLFFSANGELRNEFENLYRSLFKKSDDHITIVTALAKKGKGLTRKQIVEYTKLNNNSKFTKNLSELEKCGFIRTYSPFGKTKRDTLYQITDAFSLFHFHFMDNNKYQEDDFWTTSLNSSRHKAWSGYAFEVLCLNHLNQIKHALGISGIQCRACSWIGKSDGIRKGAQIDLLIDRNDHTINVCEIKFARSAFEITKSDDENLENKLSLFESQTKTSKSLMLTMITSFGIVRNRYAGIVQSEVTLDDLFS